MSTPAAEAYAKTQQPFPVPIVMLDQTLTHADRCDVCGAQAWVRTESHYSTLQLTWCGHHYAEVEQHFNNHTHVVTDERRFLVAAVKAQAGQD